MGRGKRKADNPPADPLSMYKSATGQGMGKTFRIYHMWDKENHKYLGERVITKSMKKIPSLFIYKELSPDEYDKTLKTMKINYNINKNKKYILWTDDYTFPDKREKK